MIEYAIYKGEKFIEKEIKGYEVSYQKNKGLKLMLNLDEKKIRKGKPMSLFDEVSE